jgi:transposase
VDTLTQAGQVGVIRATKNRRRSVKERREIVEETLLAGASVSRVARRHDVNANQVFYWRKLYREGRLGRPATELLSVKITEEPPAKLEKWNGLAARSGMEVQLAKGTLRIAGSVDVVVLRTGQPPNARPPQRATTADLKTARVDTIAGMLFLNFILYLIFLTTAAPLLPTGIWRPFRKCAKWDCMASISMS